MGRPAGSTNKNREFLHNRLKDMFGDDFDPIIKAAEMATLLQAEAMSCEDQQRVQAMKASVDGWLRIGKFLTPELRAVELTGDGDDGEITVSTIQRTIKDPKNDNSGD